MPKAYAVIVERVLPAARRRLVTIAEGARLLDAARALGEAGTDLLVVIGPGGRLRGVLTKTDVVRRVAAGAGAACAAAVGEAMTAAPLACRPADDLRATWDAMRARGLKNLPVTDVGCRPLGTLAARDALEGLLGEVEDEEALLRDYVMSVGYQ